MDENTPDGFSVRLIKLADGTLIDPTTREPINVPSASGNRNRADASSSKEVEEDDDDDDDDIGPLEVRATERRSLMDLHLNAQQMAVVNNVLVYTMWGLPDDEIAMQCNCTVHQLHVIRGLDDYKRMYESLVAGVRASMSATVDGIFAEAAPKAAKGMVKLMKDKSRDIRISAQKDILDRAGHRPADRVEHTHHVKSDELVIRVVRQSDEEAVPMMDLSANA